MERCREGCGRQAYRVCEDEFRYEGGLFAVDAGAEIVQRGPSGRAELDDYIVAIKHGLIVLGQAEGSGLLV